MLNANQSTYFVIRHPLLLCSDEASHTQTFHPILQQIYVMISVRTAEGKFTGGSFGLACARRVGVGSPILEGCAEHAETVRFWLSISTTPRPHPYSAYMLSQLLRCQACHETSVQGLLFPQRGEILSALQPQLTGVASQSV